MTNQVAIPPAASQKLIQQPIDHDAAVAQHQLTVAKSAKAKAEDEVKAAGRIARYHRVRLWFAKLGMPAWVTGLVAGSVAAMVLAVILIFAFGTNLILISVGLMLGYGVCGGGVSWFLRSLNGENDENLIQVRVEQSRLAALKHLAAIAVVSDRETEVRNADQLFRSLQQVLNSDAYKRQVETDRLLSIDPGRLYPDEFEGFVADVFRHLGFTVEVTGQSGDQGVDAVACRGPLRVAIQAKRYIDAVGNAAVQQVYAGMAHHRCHRCVVVASSGFTSGAISLAQSTGCLLIGSDKIGALIRGEVPLG